jgi:hypothetical protein
LHLTSQLFAPHVTNKFLSRHVTLHQLKAPNVEDAVCSTHGSLEIKIQHLTHSSHLLFPRWRNTLSVARRLGRPHICTADATDATNPDGVDGSANACTGGNVAAGGIAISWCTRPRRLEPSGSAASTGSCDILFSDSGVTFEWRHRLWLWDGGSRIAVAAAGTAAAINAASIAAATAAGRRTSGSADHIGSRWSSRGTTLPIVVGTTTSAVTTAAVTTAAATAATVTTAAATAATVTTAN